LGISLKDNGWVPSSNGWGGFLIIEEVGGRQKLVDTAVGTIE